MTFRIVPRTEIGLPATVTNSDGSLRPPLDQEQWYTFHYTGVSSRGYATADVAAEVLRIQAVFSASKPFEYNYVIGQTEDDAIYEFAGVYQAAHSAGENDSSFGVLFLNAVNEPLTPTQIRKSQWLRDVLRYTGELRPQVDQRPHQFMPGAATACPGNLIMGQLPELVKPYVEPVAIEPYNPEANQWSLWPYGAKPWTRPGDQGNHVLYLHDVLRLKANQAVCGDVYNAATSRAVKNLQRLLTIGDIDVGDATWAAIDGLALG